MEISALEQSGASAGAADACLVVPAYENEFPLKSLAMPEGAAAVLQSLADQQVLTGKAQSCYYLPTPLDQVKGVLVLGLGAREKCAAETVRRAAGVAAGLLKQHKMQKVCLDLVQFPELPPAAFVEGVMLGQYTFDVYKKNGDEPRPDGAVRELVLLLGQGRDTEAAVSGARRAARTRAADAGAESRDSWHPAQEMVWPGWTTRKSAGSHWPATSRRRSVKLPGRVVTVLPSSAAFSRKRGS